MSAPGSIPPCPTPGCPKCEALQTIIGCGTCLSRQAEAIAKVARETIRPGQSFSERIFEVAKARGGA